MKLDQLLFNCIYAEVNGDRPEDMELIKESINELLVIRQLIEELNRLVRVRTMSDQQELELLATKANDINLDDLKSIITRIKDMLIKNKEAMNESTLNLIKEWIPRLKANDLVMNMIASALQRDPNQMSLIFDSISKFIEIEEKLVNTDLTEKLTAVLTGIEGRPMILRIIAGLI